ncbi:MAG: glycosyl transferase [Propionibacteriaceae bacterium]|nr:glycosyl transferase [Propionibacteriaceae bacterium]
MNNSLNLILVSTPIGHLGSGRGGGVELTLTSLLRGLASRGHRITLIAPGESVVPEDCSNITLHRARGIDQPSWQHADAEASIQIPCEGVLPRLWDLALSLGEEADAVINFSYDWLPLWLTPHVKPSLFHLVSMGSVSRAMDDAVSQLARWDQRRMSFHTHRQASDFSLPHQPTVVGNGFDLSGYELKLNTVGPLGWAGRVAPEKGLEDAASVAASLRETLLVWGLVEDARYAEAVEAAVPPGTIQWLGFKPTQLLQKELGCCRALLNTPKWNEAYGNVVVEAMACGVPVVAYDRGGPGELIQNGVTGWLVAPDDVEALAVACGKVEKIDRRDCRHWVEQFASHEVFARRVENWVRQGLSSGDSTISPCR